MQSQTQQLQSEIEFWKFMIENHEGTASEQTKERMRNACALAEHKLVELENSPAAHLFRQ